MPDRKPRKSVVFSDDNTMIDENGAMTTTQDTGDDKTTAESHTSGALRMVSLVITILTSLSQWRSRS